MPESPSAVRIVIADDHPIFRHGLRKLLEGEPGFAVVGEADNGEEAVRLTQKLTPDILLLDLAMPRMGGLDARTAVGESTTRVIVLTACIRETEVLRVLQLGARGMRRSTGPCSAGSCRCPAVVFTRSK